MKLKKIASLALAGIMAVSMLAGCKDNPSSSSEPTTPVTPVTGAAAAINAELDETKDQINYTESTVLRDLMTNYFETHNIKMNDAKGAVTAVARLANTDRVYGDLVKAAVSVLNADVGASFRYDRTLAAATNKYVANNTVDTKYSGNVNDKKVTNVELYVLNAEKLTEAGALKMVGQYLDDLDLPEEKADGEKNYTYTGSVASVKAETENGEGSVWVIAVTITQNCPSK